MPAAADMAGCGEGAWKMYDTAETSRTDIREGHSRRAVGAYLDWRAEAVEDLKGPHGMVNM